MSTITAKITSVTFCRYFDATTRYRAEETEGIYRNAPAGLCATIIVKHVAQLYVQGVDDDRANAQDLANQALEVLHHPSFSNGRSGIQQEMQQFVRTWIESHGREKDEVLRILEKQAVKEHRNTTDNLSGGSLLPSPEEQYQKYGKGMMSYSIPESILILSFCSKRGTASMSIYTR